MTSPTRGGSTDGGCFGCVFWLAVFIAFCIVLIKALSYLWAVL